MHEYCVIGHPREKVIYILALISITVSPFISSFINNSLNLYVHIIISLSISGFSTFTVLYIVFNKFVWKIPFFKSLFCFPDLGGEWECQGKSFNHDPSKNTEWGGKIVIKQSWDKILVTLKTQNSTSHSVSVISGIKHYPGLGYKLSYHYENTPNVRETELKKHEGFCCLTFSENVAKAEGFYFNNVKERQTYGEMVLIRRII